MAVKLPLLSWIEQKLIIKDQFRNAVATTREQELVKQKSGSSCKTQEQILNRSPEKT